MNFLDSLIARYRFPAVLTGFAAGLGQLGITQWRMALKFQPKPGMVLICDFRGFEPPEMVKRRPVVVLASNPRNQELVTIVPLSTSPPQRRQIWHHVIAGPLEPLSTGRVIWAKCDMVYTISTARLHKIRVSDTEYARLWVSPADYSGIVRSVLAGLGLSSVAGKGP